MKQKIIQHWQVRTAVEKGIGVGLAGLVVAMLVTFWLVQPLMNYTSSGEKRRVKAAQDVVWISQQKVHFPQSTGSHTAKPVAKTFAETVEHVLMQKGISAVTKGKDALTITLEIDVIRFSSLMALISELQNEQRITVFQLKLAAISDKNDSVKVSELVLKKAES